MIITGRVMQEAPAHSFEFTLELSDTFGKALMVAAPEAYLDVPEGTIRIAVVNPVHQMNGLYRITTDTKLFSTLPKGTEVSITV